MKKVLISIAAFLTLGAFVPFALASTKEFQVNTLSGGTLTTGLVSYYNLQGNSNDYWGSNNGTDTSVSYSTAYGKVNEGANYNGSTANSNLGAGTIFDFGTGAYSIEAWFKAGTPTEDGQMIGNMAGSSPYYGWSLRMWYGGGSPNVGKIIFFWNHAGSFNSPSTYDNNAWHQVIITDSGSPSYNMTMYIDGSSVATATGAAQDVSSVDAYLGYQNGGGTSYNGDLDEVGVWSKVLSANEISDLYNAGAGQTMCTVGGVPACAGKHKIILIAMKPEHFAYA